MNLESLSDTLASEPKFRQLQVRRAIFKDLIDDWNQASTLPLALRTRLNEECPLAITAQLSESADQQSLKALVTYEDGLSVETVLIRQQGGRETVCVSSQVGCPLGCRFCATGKLGWRRNLSAWEIVEQVLFWQRWLKAKAPEARVDNVVFMGMGEPLLNYDEVMLALHRLNDPDLLAIGARHLSLSTAGILPGLKKLAKEKLQFNLAISLHAPNDRLRSELMPTAGRTPIAKLLQAVDDYISVSNRRVMFEYLLIKGVNDSLEQARQLAALMKRPLYMVNLIPYNPNDQAPYQPSPSQSVKAFEKVLSEAGVAVTVRRSFGGELAAACGQLALKKC